MLYTGHYRKLLITKESKLNSSHLVCANSEGRYRFSYPVQETTSDYSVRSQATPLPLQGPQYPSHILDLWAQSKSPPSGHTSIHSHASGYPRGGQYLRPIGQPTAMQAFMGKQICPRLAEPFVELAQPIWMASLTSRDKPGTATGELTCCCIKPHTFLLAHS